MSLLSLSTRAAQIKPAGVYSYIDLIRLWLREPLNSRALAALRPLCGKLRIHDGPARFDPRYVQQLYLYQPSREALQSLAAREGVHLNYAEFALDWVFNEEFERDAAWEFVCKYHVKNHHRKQAIKFVKGTTRYTGPRRAPNVLAAYADKPSKVTGELHCVHFDWRIKGSAALRRAEISSLQDLLTINHRFFWLRRLLFYAVSLEDLGKLANNHLLRFKRRGKWVRECSGGYIYDYDKRMGGFIMREVGSTQALLDQYQSKFDIRGKCLWSIEDNHLLPPLFL